MSCDYAYKKVVCNGLQYLCRLYKALKKYATKSSLYEVILIFVLLLLIVVGINLNELN